jgi:heptosyltransferase-3
MAADAAARALTPRILVLRRDNIGDLVCTTPLLAALRARLPQAWLGALVTTYNAEVLAGNAALDEVFVYEKLKHRSGGLISHLRTRLAQMSRLRASELDCVLVPAPSPQSLKLARSLKAAQVISAPSSAPARQHEVERAFQVGKAFGLSGKPGALQIFPDARRRMDLARQLGSGPFVAVHISARRPAQRWPLDRYAALIAQLSAQQKVMLLWAPGAKDDARHPGDDDAAAVVLGAAKSERVIPVATPDLKTCRTGCCSPTRAISPT